MPANTTLPFILKNKKVSGIKRYFWHKIYRDDECVNVLVTGKIRKGKSILALKLAWDLDIAYDGRRRFDIDKDIAFTPQEVLGLANRKDPMGKCLMWDEAGLGANSREWQKKGNIILSSLFQILGFKNTINIITIPNKPDLDKQIRGLMHVHIHVRGHHNKYTQYQIRFLDMTDDGLELRPYPRRCAEDGAMERLKSFQTPMPPIELMRKYRETETVRKKEFIGDLEEKLKGIMHMEKDLKNTSEQLKEIYDTVKASPEQFFTIGELVDPLKVQFKFKNSSITSCMTVSRTINSELKKERLSVGDIP